MTKKPTTDYLEGMDQNPFDRTEQLQAELLELKLKKKITLNDKYRIQKLQQILDTK